MYLYCISLHVPVVTVLTLSVPQYEVAPPKSHGGLALVEKKVENLVGFQ